jgi:hypothetical protein
MDGDGDRSFLAVGGSDQGSDDLGGARGLDADILVARGRGRLITRGLDSNPISGGGGHALDPGDRNTGILANGGGTDIVLDGGSMGFRAGGDGADMGGTHNASGHGNAAVWWRPEHGRRRRPHRGQLRRGWRHRHVSRRRVRTGDAQGGSGQTNSPAELDT